MSVHYHRHIKLPPYQKRKNNVTNAEKNKQSTLGSRMSAGQEYPTLPEGLQPMDDQVAGHAFFDTADSVGKSMLFCLLWILKLAYGIPISQVY